MKRILAFAGIVAIILTADLAASWSEGFYYVGFYIIAFLAITNIYFFQEKRFN